MKIHLILLAVTTGLMSSCSTSLQKEAPIDSDISMKLVGRAGDPQRCLIEGQSHMDLHRPSPEHFRLTAVGDDTPLLLRIETDHTVPLNAMRAFRAQNFHHNQFWRGFRMQLQADELFVLERQYEGLVALSATADMKHGQEYLLEWTAWPLGSTSGIHQSLRFVWRTD